MALLQLVAEKAEALLLTLPPSPENAATIARAYLDELGDLPEDVWYLLGHKQREADAARVWRELSEMRAVHFEKLGKPMPPYSGQWR